MSTSAYVYHAAFLCEPCAEMAVAPAGLSTTCEDSDCCPQGPYSDGGGEADTPQHCDNCNEFLRNPLTQDGYKNLIEMLLDDHGDPEIEAEWAEFYDIKCTDCRHVAPSHEDDCDLAHSVD